MAALSHLLASGIERATVVLGPTDTRLSASLLREAGERLFADGDSSTVGAVLTNDRASVELLFGAVTTGSRLVSLPLPPRGTDLQDYVALIRRISRSQGLTAIVARDDIASLLQAGGCSVQPHSTLDQARVATRGSSGFELVQYSSGTTGEPKGVALTDEMLGANVEALLRSLSPRAGDSALSWLPLSHDMGLVGMLFTAVAAMSSSWVDGGDVVLLDPSHFLRRPRTWLELMSKWGTTFTASPDFGYRLTARRAGTTTTLDLSALRCAIIGAEIVRVDTLTSTVNALAPAGFDPLALCPAYGLAEAGLAVTMTPPPRPEMARARGEVR